jgi:beta-glucosidase
VGIVLILVPAEPETDSAHDFMAAEKQWSRDCRWFLDPLYLGRYPEDVYKDYGNHAPLVEEGDMEIIKEKTDFLGVNYYFRFVVGENGVVKQVPGAKYTEMDWEVHAESLSPMLLRLHKEYGAPTMYITENGAAFPDQVVNGEVHDRDRLDYIAGHLLQVHDAIAAGADVKGYFAWSLLDNFEWAYGYSKRFGLTYNDFASQKRIIKDSGRWYAKVARTGELEVNASSGTLAGVKS